MAIVRRKYNLGKIGSAFSYETVDFEIEAETFEEATKQIEEWWGKYKEKLIQSLATPQERFMADLK